MSRRYVTRAVLGELEARLTAQDWAILRSVSDLRFMTGSQLQRLHYKAGDTSARATRRALRRLIDSELLNRLPRVVGGVRAGSQGFVYCLGLAGQKLAIDQGWQPPRRGRRSRAIGTLFLHHCLDVAELHVLLSLADRSGRLELVTLTAEPRCHRHYGGLGSQRVLKPDSFVRFFLGEFDWSYFIEVDRGTEGSGAIARKLRDYLSYEATGAEQDELGVFPKVLWTAPDEARAEAIAAEIEQLPKRGRELFGVAVFGDVMKVMVTP